ncbi:MAG TPA: polymer-forming cytoskeletal protein [Polyangiaceae bacterium]|jgi:cytoskeletal protein CcmA (bactofilin family)
MNGRKTLVEEGTQFKGSLTSDCPIEVKGRVEGDLTAPALSVSTSGAVHGKVKVGEMKSQGELAGEFDADVVQLSGSVKDNTVIRAKSLEVKLAPANGKMQVIFGECELEVGSEQPAKEAAKEKEKDKAPSARPPAPAEAAPPTETNGSSSVRPPP